MMFFDGSQVTAARADEDGNAKVVMDGASSLDACFGTGGSVVQPLREKVSFWLL